MGSEMCIRDSAYVEHGNVSILREGLGIDSDSIIRTMKAGGYIGKKD